MLTLDFKKCALALAASAIFVAPAAFADPAAEGIIYQVDQTNAQANINQVSDDQLPQAAAILQIDTTGTGNTATDNIATVIQGAVSGSFQNVVIDPTGATASNTATTTFANAIPGTTDIIAPIATDLTGYTDQLTGTTPFLYTIAGQASNNYGLVLQNGQIQSQAVVIQATSLETDAAITAQDSLTNTGLLANADTTTNPATINGSLDFFGSDYNDPVGQNSVEVTYSAGALTVTNSAGTVDFSTIANFLEPDNAEGNLAFVNQGGDLTGAFASVNVNGLVPAAGGTDTFAGSDVTNNEALAIQDTIESYIGIGQQGSLNTAIAFQNNAGGDGQDAIEIYQYDDTDAGGATGSPTNEFALVAQVGSYNLAQVYQAGQFNSAYVYQLGDGNIAEVDQAVAATGGGAIAFVYQSNAAAGGDVNTGNYASIYQHQSGS